MQRAREIVRINFGAQHINDLLGGGLESKAITEMFGEYRWDLSLPAYMLLLLAMISWSLCSIAVGANCMLTGALLVQDWQDTTMSHAVCHHTDAT